MCDKFREYTQQNQLFVLFDLLRFTVFKHFLQNYITNNYTRASHNIFRNAFCEKSFDSSVCFLFHSDRSEVFEVLSLEVTV